MTALLHRPARTPLRVNRVLLGVAGAMAATAVVTAVLLRPPDALRSRRGLLRPLPPLHTTPPPGHVSSSRPWLPRPPDTPPCGNSRQRRCRPRPLVLFSGKPSRPGAPLDRAHRCRDATSRPPHRLAVASPWCCPG